MKLCLIYQNHVDFNHQTTLCALQNFIADFVHASQYKSIHICPCSNFYVEQLVHQFWVSLIMFNNITEPNQIVVIDSINHFIKMIFVNCQLSHDVSGYKDLMGQEYFILSLIAVIKFF